MVSGTYCPFCGAPVTAAGARFCDKCGREFVSAEATPPASAAPYAAAPIYGAPMAAPIIVQSAKSQGVALLLEFLLPGAGSLYLGRIAQGLTWLFGSLIASFVAPTIAFISATSAADACVSQPNFATGYPCTPDYTITDTTLVIAGIAAIVWLIIRLVVVSNQATQAKAPGVGTLAMGAYGSQPQPAADASVSVARMIGLAVLLAALVFLSGVFLRWQSPGVFVAGAYLLMIRRLSRVSWGRAAIEAFLLMLAVGAVAGLLPVLSYGVYFGFGRDLIWRLLAAVIGSLVASGIAQWSAPWSGIRAAQSSHDSGRFGLYAALVVIGILVVIALPGRWYFVLAFVPSIAIIAAAAIETSRLKRLATTTP